MARTTATFSISLPPEILLELEQVKARSMAFAQNSCAKPSGITSLFESGSRNPTSFVRNLQLGGTLQARCAPSRMWMRHRIFVVPTDEEIKIGRHTLRLIK